MMIGMKKIKWNWEKNTTSSNNNVYSDDDLVSHPLTLYKIWVLPIRTRQTDDTPPIRLLPFYLSKSVPLGKVIMNFRLHFKAFSCSVPELYLFWWGFGKSWRVWADYLSWPCIRHRTFCLSGSVPLGKVIMNVPLHFKPFRDRFQSYSSFGWDLEKVEECEPTTLHEPLLDLGQTAFLKVSLLAK